MVRSGSRSSIAAAGYALWTRLQVELQGKYSLERLRHVELYTTRVSRRRIAWLCLVTPVPCALVTLLLDRIRIEPVRAGAAHSPRLWVRCAVSLWLFTVLVLQQQRSLMPRAVLTTWLVLVVSTIASATTIGTLIALALRIGYPLPFSSTGGLIVWLVVTLACLYLGSRLRACLSFSLGAPMTREELRRCAALLVCQVVPTCVYTLLNAAYVLAAPRVQPLFIAALPLLKILVKNAISFSLRDLDDLKPETVIFNVDIFHALFVACAMQAPSTSSAANVAVLVGIDVVQSLTTLYDLHTLAKELAPIQAKLAVGSPRDAGVSVSSLLCVARFVAETDQSVKSSRSIRASLWPASALVAPIDDRRPVSRRERAPSPAGSSASTNAPRRELIPPPRLLQCDRCASPVAIGPTMDTTVSDTATSTAEPTRSQPPRTLSVRRSSLARIASGLEVAPQSVPVSQAQHLLAAYRALNESDRLLLVHKTLQIMYVTEFAVLIEYTEVIMPLIYIVCLVGSFHSPNRDFFVFLLGVDNVSLSAIVRNVLLYAALELASLAALCVVVRRRLGVSLVHQLAFVLDRQYINVQCKIVSWVIFIIQASLVQLGSDHTFTSVWLHHGTTKHLSDTP